VVGGGEGGGGGGGGGGQAVQDFMQPEEGRIVLVTVCQSMRYNIPKDIFSVKHS